MIWDLNPKWKRFMRYKNECALAHEFWYVRISFTRDLNPESWKQCLLKYILYIQWCTDKYSAFIVISILLCVKILPNVVYVDVTKRALNVTSSSNVKFELEKCSYVSIKCGLKIAINHQNVTFWYFKTIYSSLFLHL